MKKPKKPTLRPVIGQQAKFRPPVACVAAPQVGQAAPKSSIAAQAAV